MALRGNVWNVMEARIYQECLYCQYLYGLAGKIRIDSEREGNVYWCECREPIIATDNFFFANVSVVQTQVVLVGNR